MAIAMPPTEMSVNDLSTDMRTTGTDPIGQFIETFGTLPVQNPSLGYLLVLQSRIETLEHRPELSRRARELLSLYGLADKVLALA